jgi:tetratricopeptide (TPR) repeat protein
MAAMAIAAGTVLLGCGPSERQMRLARAMGGIRGDVNPDYRDAIGILEEMREDSKYRSHFVQYGMCETTVAVLGGHYALGDEVSKHTHLAVQRYQDPDRETAAALGNEALKFFKGEPHERAMLAFYAGLLCYVQGEYNDARIFFTQSLLATATRDEDMEEFRDDFRLGHFWLGRAYLRLGQADNAGIAFSKAAMQRQHKNEDREVNRLKRIRMRERKKELKAEAVCFKKHSEGEQAVEGIVDLSKPIARAEMPAQLAGASASDPTLSRAASLATCLAPEFQQQANLLVVVELGRGPIKYLAGSSGSIDRIRRCACKEAAVDIYVDGHRSGPGFCLLDMYHQAVTRGVKTRRGRQVGKAIAKEVLKRTPFVGMVAGYWDIAADARYWPSLPGQVHIYAARVTPGLHTLELRFYDANDQYLPRFDMTRHYINVPERGDIVLVLHAVENQENAYVLMQKVAQK